MSTRLGVPRVARPVAIGCLLVANLTWACAGSDQQTDGAAAADTSSESWTLTGQDGSWTATIGPDGIVFRRPGVVAADSLVFAYRAPRAEGVVRTFTSVRMAADTHRIDITLASAACADRQGGTWSHTAKLWLDQVEYGGCARQR